MQCERFMAIGIPVVSLGTDQRGVLRPRCNNTTCTVHSGVDAGLASQVCVATRAAGVARAADTTRYWLIAASAPRMGALEIFINPL